MACCTTAPSVLRVVVLVTGWCCNPSTQIMAADGFVTRPALEQLSGHPTDARMLSRYVMYDATFQVQPSPLPSTPPNQLPCIIDCSQYWVEETGRCGVQWRARLAKEHQVFAA